MLQPSASDVCRLEVNPMEEEGFPNLKRKCNLESHQRALANLDEVKNSFAGVQMSISTITKGTLQDPELKFSCFQVIEHFSKKQYQFTNAKEQRELQEFVSLWLQLQCHETRAPDPVYLCNKAVQIFALVFVEDFPSRWPTFFTDLIKTLSLGPKAVDNYLRILKAIYHEVASLETLRTPEEMHRNKLIKNAMRKTAVIQLADSWYQILQTYQGINADVICQCLEVIGTYVSWINIALVANDSFEQVIFKLLTLEDVREAAIDLLYEIISKRMDALGKVHLIEDLVSNMEASQAIDPIAKDGTDFTRKLSRFFNGVGMNLIAACRALTKIGSPEQCQVVHDAIDTKIPLMIRFLNNDNDHVSLAILDFAREYVHMLKLEQIFSDEKLIQNMPSLLTAIIRKMKFDEYYQYDHEGEIETKFLDYRKQLKGLFVNLVGLNRKVVLEFTNDYITTKLQDWRTSSFQEVEVAISLIYHIGEAFPRAVVDNWFLQCDTNNPSAMQLVMRMLVLSGVGSHPHSAVVLQYLETISRYEKFFVAEPQHLPNVLLAFLDGRGMRHPNCKVQSRCAFLFLQFIKNFKNQNQSYSVGVLLALKDLLVHSIPHNGDSTELPSISLDDQMLLYEAATVLIVSSSPPSQQIEEAFRELLLPALTKFKNWIAELQVESDESKCDLIVDCLCHVMALIMSTSRAFPDQHSIRVNDCGNVYQEALQIILQCLRIPRVTTTLKASLSQFLHCMVFCLEEELLPFIPLASQVLLQTNDMKGTQEYLTLITHLVNKFKKKSVPFLQVFVSIVNVIFRLFAAPAEENDLQAKNEMQLLVQNYSNMMLAIAANGLIEVIKIQGSSITEKVLMSVINGAVYSPDPVVQKTCFSTLRIVVATWGSDYDQPIIFAQFVYKHIVPACFLTLMKPTVDLETLAALAQSANCLKTIHRQRGNEFINYLKNEYLPTLQVSSLHIQEFCEALPLEKKKFQVFVQHFFRFARERHATKIVLHSPDL